MCAGYCTKHLIYLLLSAIIKCHGVYWGLPITDEETEGQSGGDGIVLNLSA